MTFDYAMRILILDWIHSLFLYWTNGFLLSTKQLIVERQGAIPTRTLGLGSTAVK